MLNATRAITRRCRHMNKRKNIKPILVLLILVLMPPRSGWTAEGDKAAAFAGQDLDLQGQELVSYRLSPVDHVLVFKNGLSLSIGSHQFSADGAVVGLGPKTAGISGSPAAQAHSPPRIDYQATGYLQIGR